MIRSKQRPRRRLRRRRHLAAAGTMYATLRQLIPLWAGLALSRAETMAPSIAPSAAPSVAPSTAPVGFIADIAVDPMKFNYNVVFTADVPPLLQVRHEYRCWRLLAYCGTGLFTCYIAVAALVMFAVKLQ
ncbi:hypothetical protein JKP88DRAFT_268195, partial [Tribonema minus]